MADRDFRVKWVKPKLDIETLRRLKQKDDRRAWLQIISEFVVTAAAGVFAWITLTGGILWLGLPALYLYFFFYSWLTREGAFHELLHGTPFTQKSTNQAVFRLVAFLGWMNPDYVRPSHLRHHNVTLHEDQDMDVALSVDSLDRWDILFALTFNVRQFWVELERNWKFAFGRIDSDYDRTLFPESAVAERKKLKSTSRWTLAGHLLLIALFAVTGQWLLILMVSFGAFFFTGPHLLASMTQHVGMEPNVNDWRICARSVRVDPVTSWLYWRMEYHVEHHMYPSIPFYRLPELRKEIRPYLPRRMTLREAWRDIRVYLRERKTNPNAYCRVGEFKKIP